ncbi:hypothetical protein HPP92_021165 [Vanilla planifolia]|uniref:Uncharacterized protein n=1 Tax=Vanilla planifolia TaxID=51239 RepID=A0A835UGV2_VANPL|nr:hypothetical protein HPP92_021165 [Vanilla planifolia]
MESQAKQQLLKVVEERFLATGNGLRHFAARSSLDSAQYSHSGDTVLGRIGAHETLQSSCPSCWKSHWYPRCRFHSISGPWGDASSFSCGAKEILQLKEVEDKDGKLLLLPCANFLLWVLQ